jgi:hypothetical protein
VEGKWKGSGVDVLTYAAICWLMLVTWCHQKENPQDPVIPRALGKAGLRLGG